MSGEITVLGDVLALVGSLDSLRRRHALAVIANIRDLDDTQYSRILRVLDLYYGDASEAPQVEAPSAPKARPKAAPVKIPVKGRAMVLKRSGLSYTQVAEELNREGYKTPSGKTFGKMAAYHLTQPSKSKKVEKPSRKPEKAIEDPKDQSLDPLKSKVLHLLKSGPKAPREICPEIGLKSNDTTFRTVMLALLGEGKVSATGATSTRRYQIAE